MKAIDAIRYAMQFADQVTDRFSADMSDAALVAALPNGNHTLWNVGHLAFIEGGLARILSGDDNPVQHWEPLFAMGSTPKNDPEAYPPFEEVLATYRDLHAKNLKRLETIGEAGLDAAPKWIPPGFENEMRTVGQTFLTIAMHNMIHVGQIIVARRAAGRKRFI